MEQLASLINTKDLKVNYWSENLQNKNRPETKFNKEMDSFSVLFRQGKERVLVHYVDHYVSVLFRASDLEVVGLRIESFNKFFTTLVEKKMTWKLSETGLDLQGGEFEINCSKKVSTSEAEKYILNTAVSRTKKEGLLIPSYN